MFLDVIIGLVLSVGCQVCGNMSLKSTLFAKLIIELPFKFSCLYKEVGPEKNVIDFISKYLIQFETSENFKYSMDSFQNIRRNRFCAIVRPNMIYYRCRSE